MTKLITITRAFEGATAMMDQSNDTQRAAIRELGETS